MASIIINELPPSPKISNSFLQICKGQLVQITATDCSNILWYDNTSGSGNPIASGPTITVSPDKDIKYYALCSMNSCLSSGTEAMVKVHNNPDPGSITGPSGDPIGVCEGNMINLSSNSSIPGIWESDNNTIINPINPNQSGSNKMFNAISAGKVDIKYTVYEIINSNLTCSSSTKKNVEVFEKPVVSITPNRDISVCIGQSAFLVASGSRGNGNYMYKWDNQNTSNTIQISPVLNTNTYTVTVTDGNKCTNSAALKVSALDTPIISFKLETPPNNSKVIKVTDNSILNSGSISFKLTLFDANGKKVAEKTTSNTSNEYFFTPSTHGRYQVCLELENSNSCYGKFCKNYILQDTTCNKIITLSTDKEKYCSNDSLKNTISIIRYISM